MSRILVTGNYPFSAEEQAQLAAELTGVLPEHLLKVRMTDDGLVVIIHTGQKFIYDLRAIQAAVERLADGAGRFAREHFLAQLDEEAEALLRARDLAVEAAPPVRPTHKRKGRGGPGGPRP